MARRITGAAPIALALAALTSCATRTAGPADAGACSGFVPPALVALISVPLPTSYASARAGAEVTDEMLVGRDGSVREVRLVRSNYPFLAPFAEETLKRSKFSPASIEHNPVATRVQTLTQIGSVVRTRGDLPYDTLRAFVPGGASREARWQLAGSVERLTLVAHVGSLTGQNGAIFGVAPAGTEKLLLAVPAAPSGQDVRETVRTGKFFAVAGDYRLELRGGGKVLASTTVTIAAGFETAIVNACEPIRVR